MCLPSDLSSLLGAHCIQGRCIYRPAKVEKVATWPMPTNRKEVQRFLGFAGYYWRFIKDFAKIAQPLHCLTEQGRVFRGSDEWSSAFEDLWRQLVKAPMLAYPDLTIPRHLFWTLMQGIQALELSCHRKVMMEGKELLPMAADYSASHSNDIQPRIESWSHTVSHNQASMPSETYMAWRSVNEPETTWLF